VRRPGLRGTTTSRRNLEVVSDLDVRDEPIDSPSAELLTLQVQQEYVVRYGGPDTTPVDRSEFTPPRGRFLVGYLDAEPVAMGGIRLLDADTVEIKRMYVVPHHRGRGIARVLLRRLEELAAEVDARRVILETGLRQPEAMALYASSGYERIDGFGHYRGEPLSASFGKTLAAE
jgi:GNAT superfamily N-acetyltransferase